MSFATFTNIIVIFIGAAVLVQSVRMMRSFRAVKDGGLKQMVEALDKATGQARLVLADLKDTLRTEGAANARAVVHGETIRDELAVMVGIANAAAERVMETVEASKPQPAKPLDKPAPAKRAGTRPSARKAVAEVRS
jgi:chemotaxis regulatin CheY-phosphate phosphatase CheZ